MVTTVTDIPANAILNITLPPGGAGIIKGYHFVCHIVVYHV